MATARSTSTARASLPREMLPLTPLEQLHAEIRACRACQAAGLLAEAVPLASAQALSGARLMLIGQAPSRAAIQEWRPFAGVGGRRLVEWMAWAGMDEPTFRREIYMTAMTKCFPGPSPKG